MDALMKSEQQSPVRQRIALAIEFDGKLFHGWQRQTNAFTVQEALEIALLAIEGEQSCPNCVAAGRTDTGVHATHMLIHIDVLQSLWQRSPQAYMLGVNHKLPAGVLVHGIRQVSNDFHARFGCIERKYQYKIYNRVVNSVHQAGLMWWVARPLDVAAMNQAAGYLLGEHDFTTFRAAGCQAHSSVRHMKELRVKRDGDVITIDVAADAFLYHMVRNLVGSLADVGNGRWKAEYIIELLQKKNRCLAAATAPAHGLYFSNAVYPEFSAQDISGFVGQG
ncbi:MAG: tRNA pseudouridine(38-40) synthase TruA [Ghiorsea sp.]